MEWLRLTGLSIGSLTTTILLGLIVLYLLTLKQKARDTWYLIGYMGSLFVLIAAYTLRYSIYHRADVWTGQMANLVVFGGVFLVQFAYHYRRQPGRREPVIALVVSLVVAGVVWFVDFFSAGLPGVPVIRILRNLPRYGLLVSSAALVFHLWSVVVLMRKSRALSAEGARISVPDPDRRIRATRNFAFLFGSTAAVAATHLLFRSGVISRTSYVTIFNIGSLIIGLLILVVYLNNSAQPVSFLLKLVSVSLATVLVSLGLAATALSPVVESSISDYFAVKAERAAATASGAISGVGMDPDIGFVINNEGDAIYSASSTPQSSVWRASAALRSSPGLSDDWGDRLRFIDQYDANELFLTRRTFVSGETFRVGISYAAYRLVAHRFWARLALVVVGTSAFIVAVFPVFFGRSLLLPIRRLIQAVEKVSLGDFGQSVPVVSEDETGRLSRAYNEMINSLRQAEGNFQALAENANDAILLISDGGLILYANTRAQELTGSDGQDLIGTFIGTVIPGAQGGRQRQPADGRITRGDGTTLPVEITGGQTEWHGQPAEVVIIRDLSERKAAEALVRDQQQQIMQADKLASIGVLVAGVAHEIHNPNQVIALRAHVISEGLRDLFGLVDDAGGVEDSARVGGLSYPEFKEAAVQGVQEIRGSTQRINKIVSELKGYVRSGGGVGVLTTEVNDAVRTVTNMCSHLIKTATDSFSVQLGADPLTASIGKTELEQVILNLVQNACHALPNRRAAITVATHRSLNPDRVVITVADEGTGMPEETLNKVFDPFFTTKRESGGTGLGLSVSRRLVKQAGGELHIESALGKGTRAVIELSRG